MSIDDTVLLAYVDGQLTPERRVEVEAAAAASSEVAGRLASMKASVLPYAAAFGRQALPSIPEHLVDRADESEESGG